MGEIREPKKQSIIEQAQRSIFATFEAIHLAGYMQPSEGEGSVAILAAGYAVEVEPLAVYLATHGLGTPRIVAYSLERGGKVFSEKIASSRGIALDYRIADVSNSASFKEEEYDLVIIRKPDVHRGWKNWRSIIQNGFAHLKPTGCMLVTTSEQEAYELVFMELQRAGEVCLEHTIPETLQISPFFNENKLVVVKKQQS